MITLGAIFILLTTVYSLLGSDSCVKKHPIWISPAKIHETDLEGAKILKKLSMYIAEQNCSDEYKEYEINVLKHLETYCADYGHGKTKQPTSMCDHIKKYIDSLEHYDPDLVRKKLKKITWHLLDVSKHIDADNYEFKKMFLRLFGIQLKNHVNVFDLSHKHQTALRYALTLENSVAIESLLQFNQDLKSLTNVPLTTLSAEEINDLKSSTTNQTILEKFDKRYRYRPQFKGHYN